MKFRTNPPRFGVIAFPRLAALGAVVGACLVSTSTNALTIRTVFDTSVTSNANAANIESAVNAAARTLGAAFGNAATVTVNVSWGSVAGQSLGSGEIASSVESLMGPVSFATIEADMRTAAAANPANAVLRSIAAHLPTVDPSHGRGYSVPYGEAQALGLLPASMHLAAGAIGFNRSTIWDFTNSNGVASGAYDLQGAATHEIMEVLGRISGLELGSPTTATPFDLFRYSAPGVSSFSYTAAAYFSVDGGVTHLQNFNVAGAGDRSDLASQTGVNDVQDAYLTRGAVLTLSSADMTALDALGWGAFTMPLGPASSGLTDGSSLQGFGSAVPEPHIWLMMTLGLAAVGGAARSRAFTYRRAVAR